MIKKHITISTANATEVDLLTAETNVSKQQIMEKGHNQNG